MRRDGAFEFIIAALRGFCLLISNTHAVGISAKESAHILYPASFQSDLFYLDPKNAFVEKNTGMCEKKSLSAHPL